MGEERGGTHGVGRIGSRIVHEGARLKVSVDRVRFPDGSEGDLEMIRHPGAAAIVPIMGSLQERDPEVVLIRQYRYAADGTIFEIPAGVPDRPGEPWEECARRELEEETGFTAGALRAVTSIWTTPGFTDEVIHLFVASALEPGVSKLDDDEFVEVVIYPMSKVLDMIERREIVDAKSIAAILFAERFVIGRAVED